MATQDFTLLPVKCAQCSEPLVRVTLPETYDRVYCVQCGGVGDYEQVIERTAGLIGGLLTEEELLDLREQFRLAREQRK